MILSAIKLKRRLRSRKRPRDASQNSLFYPIDFELGNFVWQCFLFFITSCLEASTSFELLILEHSVSLRISSR